MKHKILLAVHAFALSFSFLFAGTSSEIFLKSNPDQLRRKSKVYQHVSPYQLGSISEIIRNKADLNSLASFPLLSSADHRYMMNTPFIVSDVKGDVKVQSVGSLATPLVDKSYLKLWDKVFTANKSSLKFAFDKFIKFELSKQSSLQVQSVNEDSKKVSLFLTKGCLRARVNNGVVNIRTLNAEIFLRDGFSDVIISGLNTFIAPRKCKSVDISTKSGQKRISPGFYALITPKGGIVISETNQKKSKRSKKVTKKAKEELIKRRELSRRSKDDPFQNVLKFIKFGDSKE